MSSPKTKTIFGAQVSVRTYHNLKAAKFETPEELAEYGKFKLKQLRNFGAGTIAEIQEILLQNNLKLKP